VKRLEGIDVIRTSAIALVVLIHTMMFLGIWQREMNDLSTFVEVMIFRLTWICVPLFLMLTGYLNYKKEASKGYFKSIGKTALIFLFYSVLVIIFRAAYQHEDVSLWGGIKMILDNTTQDRAWYVNMYFGLVLLIPFVNVAWKMFNKKQKIIIIVILYLLTSVSKYIYSLSGHYMETPIIFVSSFWYGLYFFVYYFLGAFIREYPIKIRKLYILASLIVLLALHTSVYFIVGQGGQYGETFLHQNFWYDNPVLYIEAVLFFLLFYDIQVKGKAIKSINQEISLSAFEMYLFSIITDTICFNYFVKLLPSYPYIVLVVMMWVSSFTMAFVFTLIRRKVAKLAVPRLPQ
jgi:surface polysaccharide O-acyltransferase-like enzyme